MPGNLGAIDLGVTKHQVERPTPRSQCAHQFYVSIFARHRTPCLHNLRGRLVIGNINRARLVLHSSADSSDRLGIRCAKQQRLPLRRNVRQDRIDLVHESHIQHSVCLIQYERLERTEINIAAAQMFVHAPWGADNDVRTALQRCCLIA